MGLGLGMGMGVDMTWHGRTVRFSCPLLLGTLPAFPAVVAS